MPVPPPDILTGPNSTAWTRRVAHLLDTFLKIPGTTARIGLDPLIGLIPGVGDTIATAMGGVILADALRRRIPNRLLVRMGGNMLVNAALGAIPVIGDLFSAWFKSNTRNHQILQAYVQGHPDPPASEQSKWVFVGFAVFMLALIGLAVLAFWLLVKLWEVTS